MIIAGGISMGGFIQMGDTPAPLLPIYDNQFNYVTALFYGNGANTAQNNTFLDSSTNASTITRTGTPTQGAFSPYGANWSNYFNGSSSFLSMTGSSATNFSGVDWTVETWVYSNGAPPADYTYIIQSQTGTNNWLPYFGLGLMVNGRINCALNAANYTSTQTINFNAWNHLAMVRSGGVVKLYINGAASSVSVTLDINNSNLSFWFGKVDNGPGGGGYTYYLNGYISNTRFVKGTAVYTSNFPVPTTPLTAITNTTLLINQSNRPVDNSANAFVVTPSSTVSVQRFSPFSPQTQTAITHSAYFDGSTDWITLPSSSSAYNLTGDFTVEAWVYATAQAGADWGIIDARVSGATPSAWLVLLAPSGAGHTVRLYASSGSISNGTTVIPLNTWAHIAVVRSNVTLRIFVNGTVDLNNASYGSGSISPGTTAPRLGSSKDATGTSYMTKGYISNFRFVNGVAVYTGAFTPPTAPLTAVQASGGTNIVAISGTATSLLTFQSPTFIDASTNAFVLTPSTATIKPRTYNPFGFTNTLAAYSAATYGGSTYLNGSGDYLQTPSSAVFNLNAGDWTIEGWFYLTAAPVANQRLFVIDGASTYGMYTKVDGGIYYGLFGSSEVAIAPAGTLSGYNQWKHVAFVKSGVSTTTCYVNGVLAGSTTSYSLPNSNCTFYIAGSTPYAANVYAGYISDFRVVKGTAVYTSAFAPPVAPLSAVTNTQLLLNFVNAGIFDSSGMNNVVTVGSAQASTTQFKYGTASMKFNGTTDYLTTPSNPSFAFGTGDFTVECWIYATAVSDSPIYEGRTTGSGTTGFTLTAFSSSVIRVYTGSSALIASSGTTYLNTWTHVAVVRSGGTTTLYINGTSVGTSGAMGNLTDQSTVIGGGRYSATSAVTAYYTGYIDDLRITKGYARYTGTFTPPTAQLPGS